MHLQIILFDIAVQNEIQGGQRLCLTDTHKFQRLYSTIVMSDGVEGHKRAGSQSVHASGSKLSICNHFNSPAGCTTPDCKFKHACHQSAGHFSVNSMVDHEKVRSYPLDNMRHIGENLLEIRRMHGDHRLVMWKSDIAEAYRLMPMHPIWQIKQVCMVDGYGHVNQCNCFGGCGSGGIFISFNSLVAWIAKNIEHILGCADYVDNTSGAEFADEVSFYEPYQKLMPSKQVSLLHLWDKLGIPHKEKKQVFGSPLTIIGIDVDPNAMTLTLSEAAHEDLVKELHLWGSRLTGKSNGAFPVRRWQSLAGWANWAFNAYPLLRPCLNNVYPKLQGKWAPHQNVWVNNSIREDLNWAADRIENSTGVHLMRSRAWDPSLADVTIFCDACMDGMGFWFPDHRVRYYSPVPSTVPTNIIFYYEALCVAAALHCAHLTSPDGSRIVIYTDNSNTVDIFNTLCARPDYNPILCFAVDILLDGEHDLCVLHVAGDQNVVADALSCQDFGCAIKSIPDLKILDFQPPHLLLGANKK
ncbi:hypothetical protein NLJ89_g11390 [Agrocybe chaxingu]|uniref:C3H1-type domain-containing protein n=1 Tax=Agrocybe chaxingu TaxID=84603 RepID=A0A9W8JQ31_9AGAR|nr:hypothetical protein NLJ89_g11390 [Agrocybe chaxingu]